MDDSNLHFNLHSNLHCIQIRGARVHNLKNVNLDLPHGRLIAITGPSGSGKSSLAFDTLFAEGRRQYLESLSLYSRQFLEQLERPDVDGIEGLAPTICIDQRPGRPNLRSTLATSTEIHDYLRVLFARLGRVFCPRCDVEIHRQTLEQMKRRLLALPEGTRLILLAPLASGSSKDDIVQGIERARQAGFVRLRCAGELIDIEQLPSAAAGERLEAVVDRLVIRPGVEGRFAESLNLALRFGDGAAAASWQASGAGDQWNNESLNAELACPSCGARYPELTVQSFNFNSPYGACPVCTGLGRDEAGATCAECQGARLGEQARFVRIGGKAIHELCGLSLNAAKAFLESLAFAEHEARVAGPLLSELVKRLTFLDSVGLAYLSLDRATDSLSGGERQRSRLAAGLGGALVGACYILDEPSVGLHPRDNERLIAALLALRDAGNTLVVVEHDEALLRIADWLIDFGPGAGPEGGQVMAEGSPGELAATGHSLTCRFLRGELGPIARANRSLEEANWLRLEGAREHNLQNVDAAFPLARFTCVTGVSGSGKSSLVLDTLAPAVLRALGKTAPAPGPFDRLSGFESLQAVRAIEAMGPAYSARSNPATYIGVFDELRKLFAATREARQRGFRASRFSPADKQGRCPECLGHGEKRLEMNFLPDLAIVCPLCRGARFNRQTLVVRFRGKTIADVLAMTVAEAATFFDGFAKIAGPLARLGQIGLGYLPLGQNADTLSGGEWQRLRLAKELAETSAPGEFQATLYILDEPTTGLHYADVQRLVAVFQELVNKGHTVLAIEHHLEVARAADYLIDLGPEGGVGGGRIVAAGKPEDISRVPESHTGRFLSRFLSL